MARVFAKAEPTTTGRFRSRRTWMLLVIVLAICTLGWRSWYYSEENIVARLDSIGAKLSVSSFRLPTSSAKRWLKYFGFNPSASISSPIAVQFESPRCSQVRLKEAAMLPAVHFVRINNLPFDESSIRHLKSLPKLGSLEFRQTDLTNEGLKIACQISSVHTLEVSGSQVTDDGIAYVTQLPSLRILRLNGTKVTDACINQLLRCPNLRLVWLHETNVSSAAIRRLKQHCKVWH